MSKDIKFITLPNQRVSKKEKLKEDHYRPTVDYWINKAWSQNNKAETQVNLDAANGIVDDDTYTYVLKPLTYQIDGQTINIPGEFREVDIITPIKEKNMGEYAQLPYDFYVNVFIG